MPIAFIRQSTGTTFGGTRNQSITTSVSGNTLVLTVLHQSSGTLTVSSNAGGTWVRAAASADAGSPGQYKVDIWYLSNAPATSTVTIAASPNSTLAVNVSEYSGVGAFRVAEAKHTVPEGASGVALSANAGELLISGMGYYSTTDNATPTAPYTLLGRTGTSTTRMAAAYTITSATGESSPQWSYAVDNSNYNRGTVLAAFEPADPPAETNPNVLLNTSFTGTNGSSWPSPWNVSTGHTIQNNRGQQTTPATAWTDSAALASTPLSNGRVDATVRFTAATGASARIDVRFNTSTGNGYRIIMPTDYTGFQLIRVTNWAETEIDADFSIAWAANTDYRIAFEFDGSTIRARRWVSGTAEPSTWALEATDTAHVTGDTRLVTVTSTATPATVLWDSVKITQIPTVAPVVTNIANPERGYFFFSQTHAPGAPATQYDALTPSALTAARAAGQTLVFRYVILDQFMGTDTISQAFRDQLTADLVATRNAGMKMVLRFAYSNSGDMEPPYAADPAPSRVLSHIAQLAPVLNAHADIVDTLQAGFIGMWGEWYYTDNFGDLGVTNAQNWADRKAVVNALLDNLDSRIFVQLRYVGTKRQLLEEGLSAAKSARLGFHNDAFLAPFDDYGTYSTFTTYSTAQNRAWLEEHNRLGRYPMGGESAVGNSPTSDLPNALVELSTNRWTYLNPLYHEDVLNSWGPAGRAEVGAKLGYNYKLSNVSTVVSGNNVTVAFTVVNGGFAAAYRSHPVLIDFVSGGVTITRTLTADTKNWVPGTTNVSEVVAAPYAGTWATHLRIVDPSASLQGNVAYNIQPDGPGTYDTTSGRMPLGTSVTTTGSAPINGSASFAGSGTLAFAPRPTVAATQSFTGSGTTSLTRTPTLSASRAFTGSGALSNVRTATPATSLSLSGAGSLTTTAQASLAGSSTLAGSGTLSTARNPSSAQSVGFTGAGSLGLSATPVAVRTQGLSGTGTLSSTRTLTTSGTGSLAGYGTLEVLPSSYIAQTYNLTGSGSLGINSGPLNASASADFSGTGTLQTNTSTSSTQSIEFAGSGSLNSTQEFVLTKNVEYTGSGELGTNPDELSVSSEVALSGSGQLTTTSSATSSGSSSLSLTGSGTLELDSTTIVGAALDLSGSGSTAFESTLVTSSAVGYTGEGTLEIRTDSSVSGALSFDGSGQLDVSGVLEVFVGLLLTSDGQISGTGSAAISGLSEFNGTGVLEFVSTVPAVGELVLAGSGLLGLRGLDPDVEYDPVYFLIVPNAYTASIQKSVWKMAPTTSRDSTFSGKIIENPNWDINIQRKD